VNQPYVTPGTIAQKTEQWTKAIAPYNRREIVLNAARCALLVVDMQNYFLDPDCSAWMEATPAILPNVKTLIGEFRRRGLPILFTAHVHENLDLDGGMMARWWQELIMKGTHAADIFKEIEPLEAERVVRKIRYSAFYQTDLDTNLRCLGVEDLVITGVMTNLCCESTARDGFFRDYRIFFVMDATAAANEEFHLSTLRNLAYGFARVVDSRSILNMLSSA
jgi:isochorismate hydrolase